MSQDSHQKKSKYYVLKGKNPKVFYGHSLVLDPFVITCDDKYITFSTRDCKYYQEAPLEDSTPEDDMKEHYSEFYNEVSEEEFFSYVYKYKAKRMLEGKI